MLEQPNHSDSALVTRELLRTSHDAQYPLECRLLYPELGVVAEEHHKAFRQIAREHRERGIDLGTADVGALAELLSVWHDQSI